MGPKVRESKARITQQLTGATDEHEPGRVVLKSAFELLTRPRDLYQSAPAEARKKLNKAIFTKLYVDSTDGEPHGTTGTLAERHANRRHAQTAPFILTQTAH